MNNIVSRLFAAAILVCIAVACPAQEHPAQEQKTASEPEIHRLFVEDQKDRQTKDIDWSKVGPRDRQRRERARELLNTGEVKTARDFQDAAFIFQHSEDANDYLLAHILATVAIAKGDKQARWIAAATLDRYLHAIQQPQVFGTQYSSQNGNTYTQDPYNRTLLSDALRQELCVPPIDTQQKRAEAFSKNEAVKIPNTCTN